MNQLKTLVLMQLKDKIDFSAYKIQKGKFNKKLLFKILFSILKFAGITAVIYFGFYFLSFMRLVDLVSGIPDKFLLVVFSAMFVLSILVATISLMKGLYFSKDNTLLLTFPTNKQNIFLSKLIVFFVYELLRNVYFVLPLFLAFGIINKYSIVYFLFCFVSLVIYTLLVTSISGLLSIPAMLVNMLLKNNRIVEVTITTLFLSACIYLIIMLINLIPQNVDLVASWGTTFWEIQDFLERFSTTLSPLSLLLYAFVGERYGVIHTFFNLKQILCLLSVIGIIVGVLLLCFGLVQPLFYKMASKPFEYKKTLKQTSGKNIQRNNFLSGLHKEFLIFLRTPDKFEPLLYVAIGMPLAIFLLNKIFGAMDTRLSGLYMTISFNILIIMLILLSSNASLAKTYSEEGNSAYLNKTNPQSYWQSLLPKLVINATVMTLSLVATVAIYSTFVSTKYVSPTLLFFGLWAIYMAHLFWSAELDIMNPQISQYATTGTHTNNPNETKSTFFGFLISAFVAFASFFLINEGPLTFWWKLFVVATVFLAARAYLYFVKISLYYKEK